MKKPRSSTSMFDHLLTGLKLRQAPANVRAAFRRWAFSRHLPDHLRFRLSADELAIVDMHPQFQAYVDSEMTAYIHDNETIRVCVALAWQQQDEGTAAGFDIPWFLRLSQSELVVRREEYERSRPAIDNLITEKTVHLRAKLPANAIHLTTANEDNSK